VVRNLAVLSVETLKVTAGAPSTLPYVGVAPGTQHSTKSPLVEDTAPDVARLSQLAVTLS
jgi:hypothetical protein